MNRYRVALAFIKAESRLWARVKLAAFLAIAGLLFSPVPALAHHPSGGETPDTLFERFLSGIGYSVIGLIHLAFIVAAGLLAAVMGRSLEIPTVFVVASLASLGGAGLAAIAELFQGYGYDEAIVRAQMGPLAS